MSMYGKTNTKKKTVDYILITVLMWISFALITVYLAFKQTNKQTNKQNSKLC